MNASNDQTWPDLAIGLYDRLTGRNAEISYTFDDFRVQVPSGTGSRSTSAQWVLSGTLNISTKNRDRDPN
jgi:hypothetical protein